MAAVADAIEPDAAAMVHDAAPDGEIYLASIAISLRRLVDVIDGTTLGVDISESLAGVTGQMIRGQ